MRVRKRGTGSSSHGHEWTEPGQVLDIPVEDAAELVAIDPGEFEVLADLEPNNDGDSGEGKGEQAPVTEPDPEPEVEPEESKPARGRRKVTEA